MAFPRGSLDLTHIPSIIMKVARNTEGEAIGVEMTLLIDTKQVQRLPERYRKMAQGLLYAEAVKKDQIG